MHMHPSYLLDKVYSAVEVEWAYPQCPHLCPHAKIMVLLLDGTS